MPGALHSLFAPQMFGLLHWLLLVHAEPAPLCPTHFFELLSQYAPETHWFDELPEHVAPTASLATHLLLPKSQ